MADEEGHLTVVDTSSQARPAGFPPARALTRKRRRQLPAGWLARFDRVSRAQWLAHHNAVFDLAWAAGDTQLVSAGGDQRLKVWDLRTRACVATLRGHAGSVKSVATTEGSPWAVASSARDGAVMLWDTRAPAVPSARSSDPAVPPLAQLRDKHPPHRTGRRDPGQLPASVTAVAFLHGGVCLASGGSGNTDVRIWDVRHLDKPVVRGPAPQPASA